MGLAGLLQQDEALFLHALEAVGGGARFVGAAAQHVRPMALYGLGGFHDLLFGLDRAGARHHAEVAAADFHRAALHDAAFLLYLGARQLVGLEDGEDPLDVGEGLEGGQTVLSALIADRGDDGAFDAKDYMGLVTQFFNFVNDVVHVFLGP